MHRYDVRSHSQADPSTVFDLLLRTATWPSWSPIDSAAVEDGDPADRRRLGDLRTFRTGRAVSRERIVELVDDKSFGYNNESWFFRAYRATVELSPAPGGGTDIRWSAEFVLLELVPDPVHEADGRRPRGLRERVAGQIWGPSTHVTGWGAVAAFPP